MPMSLDHEIADRIASLLDEEYRGFAIEIHAFDIDGGVFEAPLTAGGWVVSAGARGEYAVRVVVVVERIEPITENGDAGAE